MTQIGEEEFERLEQFSICLTSAKQVTGVAKIMTILEKTRNVMRDFKHLPKVYVVGTTNSGKSTLINAMLKVQERKKSSTAVSRSQTNKKKKQERVLLTESALPGTT